MRRKRARGAQGLRRRDLFALKAKGWAERSVPSKRHITTARPALWRDAKLYEIGAGTRRFAA